MRYWSALVVLVVLCAVSPAPGAAHADIGSPATALTGDRDGVMVGSPDAPAQLEIFCDPQCPRCAEFAASSTADLARHLESGQLGVVYRWVTVLDARFANTASSTAATALAAAADPATPAPVYQQFVGEMYRNQDRDHGGGPGADELAAMADAAGVPAWVVARIAVGAPVGDTAAMAAANLDRLKGLVDEPSVPLVRDAATDTVVDIHDPGWLDRLVAAA